MGCEPPGFSLSRTCHLLDEQLNRTPPPPPRLGPAGINTLCLSGSERSVEDFQAYVLRIKPDVNIKDIASP